MQPPALPKRVDYVTVKRRGTCAPHRASTAYRDPRAQPATAGQIGIGEPTTWQAASNNFSAAAYLAETCQAAPSALRAMATCQ